MTLVFNDNLSMGVSVSLMRRQNIGKNSYIIRSEAPTLDLGRDMNPFSILLISDGNIAVFRNFAFEELGDRERDACILHYVDWFSIS